MSPDPYETRHGPEYYAEQQEAALDALELDWTWYIDRVMQRGMGYKGSRERKI